MIFPEPNAQLTCLKRNAFSGACKCTFVLHKCFYLSAFNYTNIIVSIPRDSELRDAKSTTILKMRVCSISNEVHYGVGGFICYREEQHNLVVLTVCKGKKLLRDGNCTFFYLYEKTI